MKNVAHQAVETRKNQSIRVYLSHSMHDFEQARTIAEALKEAGIDVWDAATSVSAGENWARSVGDALENCNAMVVLVSPSAMKSEHVKREIEFAITSPNFAERVIPVLIKEAKDAPWILRKFHYLPWKKNIGDLITQRLQASAHG